jgi:hypothetical protein
MSTITITLQRPLSEREVHELRGLLRDAFGEFIATREDIPAYVAKRYPDWSLASKHAKSLEISRRIGVMELIKQGGLEVT